MRAFITILILTLFLQLDLYTFAETPPANPGTIKGKVTEENRDKAIEYANIVLYKKADSTMLSGTISDINGNFDIEKIPGGEYYLEVDFIGYEKKIIKNISIGKSNKQIDLGTINLVQSKINLKETEITAERNYIDYKIDKKVINVSQHANAAGGTVSDVLDNVPSVQVDIEGNVSLRGSSQYTVLIDGKPTVISGSDMLKQIPANTVARVEIITNPSAKYDPEGTTGIINLIMKKGYTEGLNGMVSANYMTWKKYGTELTLNYRKKKVNYFLIGNYRRYPGHAESENDRETYFSDTTGYVFEKTDRTRTMRPYRINAGVDLFLNDKNTLTISGTYGGWGMDRIYNSEYESYSDFQSTHDYSISENNFTIDGIYYVGNVNYQKLFNKKEHKIDFSLMYWLWDSDIDEDSEEQLADQNFTPKGFLSHNRYLTNVDRTTMQFKADYSNPLKQGKLEAGTEIKLMDQSFDFSQEHKESTGSPWIPDDMLSNKMDFYRYLYSGYTTYASSFWIFNYQLGCRAEVTDRKLTQLSTNEEHPLNLFKLYPSVHISYSPSKKQQFQISYSRRISRPQPWQLNPFQGYSDSYNYFEGNPFLKPEDTDSYELNYINRMKKMTFSTGLFYRYTQNTMELMQLIDADQPDIVFLTYNNMNESKAAGLEFMVNYYPSEKLNVNLSGNVYHYEINSGFYGEIPNRTSTNFDGRLNTSVKLTKSLKFQFIAVYYGPSVKAQGTSEALYYFDMGLRKSFLKRKLNISLYGHNVFKTGVFENELRNKEYYSWFIYEGEAPVVRLNISYIINNYKRKQRETIDIGAGAN